MPTTISPRISRVFPSTTTTNDRPRRMCVSLQIYFPPCMATNQSSSATVVQRLAELLRANGHRVLHGDSKVCFTSDSLTLLNNYFQSAKLDVASSMVNGQLRTNPLATLTPVQQLRINNKLRDDLVFLHDFLQKIQAVKVRPCLGDSHVPE